MRLDLGSAIARQILQFLETERIKRVVALFAAFAMSILGNALALHSRNTSRRARYRMQSRIITGHLFLSFTTFSALHACLGRLSDILVRKQDTYFLYFCPLLNFVCPANFSVRLFESSFHYCNKRTCHRKSRYNKHGCGFLLCDYGSNLMKQFSSPKTSRRVTIHEFLKRESEWKNERNIMTVSDCWKAEENLHLLNHLFHLFTFPL